MKLSTVMNVVSKYVRSEGDGNGYCTTILKFQHYVSFVVKNMMIISVQCISAIRFLYQE